MPMPSKRYEIWANTLNKCHLRSSDSLISMCQSFETRLALSLSHHEYNTDDLIGRTFSPQSKGLRASIKQKVIEISQKLDKDQNTMVDSINFLLDAGQGRSQAIISYKQVLNYLEKENQDDETL